MEKASKAGEKQAKKQRNANIVQAGKATQFKKRDPKTGEIDPRINTKGRPRKFDALREMVLDVLTEELELTNRAAGTSQKITQLEFMIREWVLSRDFNKQSKALEYGFGKVPDEIKHHFDEDEFIKRHIDKFTDGELQRVQQGENGMDILLSKLETQLTRKKS